MAKSIMFQGTGSGVGKSLLTAGFCRLLRNTGIRVAPFKSQNMALNAGVTADGLEMGRAQILQAEAAGIAPDVRMNPILLKPQGQSKSQLVRMGKVVGTYSAREYYGLSAENFDIVKDAYTSLTEEYDIIIIEGAGSPAEINLQRTDIVNMRVAQFAGADVYIIGDIDRGGVFAWMKGTYDLLPDGTQEMVKGFIINKFRGDISLLEPGIKMFEEMVSAPVMGVIPYFRLSLEEEDSQGLVSDTLGDLKIGVIRLPYISNFSDFAPLHAMDNVCVKYITKPHEVENCDILIIPGSKSTVEDMKFLRLSGLDKTLINSKKPVIGICGGFQMLGKKVSDPQGIEGNKGEAEGLGLLPCVTVITENKMLAYKTYNGENEWSGFTLKGYEIHMGKTEAESGFLAEEGSCMYNGNVFGTYLHGFFEHAENIRALNAVLDVKLTEVDYLPEKERQLNLLAQTIKENCNVNLILQGII